MSPVHRDSGARIDEAVARAYRDAELQPALAAGVVPLDALIGAYPLHHAELPRLTRRRALGYLRRRTGADLPDLPGPDDALAGFLYVCPYEGEVWGCLLVEQEDIIERRRFSAAHELGHYLLHFLPLMQEHLRRGEHLFLAEGFRFSGAEEEAEPGPAAVALSDATGASPRPGASETEAALRGIGLALDELEAEANRFAAGLLMPEAACRSFWERHRGRASHRRLAQELLVSPAAAHVRLRALGLLS